MDKAEAIWYLQPIADSASLERYSQALHLAIEALKHELALEKVGYSFTGASKSREGDY